MTPQQLQTESTSPLPCGEVPELLKNFRPGIDVDDGLTRSIHGGGAIDDEQKKIQSKTNEECIGRWLARDNLWTHFVTPTTHPASFLGKKPSVELGLAFRSCVVQYYDVLALDVYGRKSQQRPITHATSFECKSIHGNWTPWHAHSLVYVEPEFWEYFETKAAKLWSRRFCNRPGAITVKRITHDITTVASYSAKHDDADYGVEPLYSKYFKHSK